MKCSTCTDEARCDRLGLCQDVAKQQLPGPAPRRPAVCECDLEETITEQDRGRCACCGGVLV